jgi:iron(III) transport system substrate-binding protein
MRRFRATRIVAAMAGAAVVAAACGGGDPTDDATGTAIAGASTLTVYSGRAETLVAGLVEQFEAASGVQVEVRYGTTAEMAAALLEEGRRSPADVFFSQEVGALAALAEAGLLTALPDEVVAPVDPRFKPPKGNQWVGTSGRARVIVYNADLVADPPRGVLELTDPRWKGKVAAVPSNASFQAFVTAFRLTRGEAAAERWLEQMLANGLRTDIRSNADLLKAVNDGQVPVGLINHYYWGVLAAELGTAGMKAKLVFPEGDDPGGLFNAAGVGITTGGADNPAARAFVEYLLSPEGQRHVVANTFEYPVVDGIGDPAGFPARATLGGPAIDLGDLRSLETTQAMLRRAGLIS